MKAALRKTEFRKTATFIVFTALVIFMLHIDAEANRIGATVAETVQVAETFQLRDL